MSGRGRSMAAMLLALTALGAASCGGGGPTPREGGSSAPDRDPSTAAGRRVYSMHCARCHGDAGRGGLGPSLINVERRYLEIDDQIAVVVNGRGIMPSFSGRLDQAEIRAVVRYVREDL